MNPIKESFKRVKEDMDFLKIEVNSIRESIIELCEILEKMPKKEQKTEQITRTSIPAHSPENPTIQHITPTHNLPFKPLTPLKHSFSTGNEGVPADRQTDQQTDKYTKNIVENMEKAGKYVEYADRYAENTIENATEMLKSLDNIKKEIRQKFKKLTEQEWLVFSTIYQLDEEIGSSDYRIIAEKLHLTESSIRDYVGKLIKKGIPVDKTKLNNKNIQLNISQNLKKIASLPTIIALRDL